MNTEVKIQPLPLAKDIAEAILHLSIATEHLAKAIGEFQPQYMFNEKVIR